MPDAAGRPDIGEPSRLTDGVLIESWRRDGKDAITVGSYVKVAGARHPKYGKIETGWDNAFLSELHTRPGRSSPIAVVTATKGRQGKTRTIDADRCTNKRSV